MLAGLKSNEGGALYITIKGQLENIKQYFI